MLKTEVGTFCKNQKIHVPVTVPTLIKNSKLFLLINIIKVVGHIAFLSDLARHIAERKKRFRSRNTTILKKLVTDQEPVIKQTSQK